jgi:peroxiredoxin
MKSMHVPVLALILSMFAAMAPLHASDPPKITEAQFRSQMGIPDGASVTYLDAAGKPVPFARFIQAATHGGSFDKTVDTDSGKARFRILAKTPEPAPPATLSVKQGDALPNLQLATLDGRRVDNAALQGHYTLMSFFFAECAPCIAEIPALNTFAHTHPDVRVLAVTFDDPAKARAFKSERGLAWPVLADAQSFIDAVGVQTYPMLLLVGPDGAVAGFTQQTRSGGTTAEGLDAWVRDQRGSAALR